MDLAGGAHNRTRTFVRRTTMLMMTTVLMNIKLMEVEGVNRWAWQKIYDHWDLGTKILHKRALHLKEECRYNPCETYCYPQIYPYVYCDGLRTKITKLKLQQVQLTDPSRQN